MKKSFFILCILTVSFLFCILPSCHVPPPKQDVAKNVQSLHDRVSKDINSLVIYLMSNGHKLIPNGKDSLTIYQADAVQQLYQKHHFSGLWSDTGKLYPQADTMLQIIHNSVNDGLLPVWYHSTALDSLFQEFKTDSLARLDAIKWSYIDIFLSDAFMRLCNNIHYGLLPPDSISLQSSHAFSDSILISLFDQAVQNNKLQEVLDSLKPPNSQYQYLSKALTHFRKENTGRLWDTLPVKYIDTARFEKLLAERLTDGGYMDSSFADSASVVQNALKAFQRKHALFEDGVAGPQTIAELNLSKDYRLQQIAVNMERWKHLANLPKEYILINIPSYTLTLWNNDTAVIRSKVITGSPRHATPLLNSNITNFQLYPYWRVPISIVVKEMIPRILKDTGYLRKNNLEILDRRNNIIDPKTLAWKKFNIHYFPYLMRQMTGLDNSLGIIKFNFRNTYSVYLHDTNLRVLFGLTNRDLSHGCVRVQEWKPLAMYMIRNDTLRHLPDSVKKWIAESEQKTVFLRPDIPVYIRYITCEANDKGDITFYPDVYGYDSIMMKKMFPDRSAGNEKDINTLSINKEK